MDETRKTDETKAEYNATYDREVVELMFDEMAETIQYMDDIQRLAILRKHVDDLKKAKAEYMAELEANVDYCVVRDSLKIAETWLKDATDGARSRFSAMVRVQFDGKKYSVDNPHPHAAVTVQVGTLKTYKFDPEVAYKYAFEKMPALLMLNEEKLKKAADQELVPAWVCFVAENKIPVASFASDLSAYIPKEVEEEGADDGQA